MCVNDKISNGALEKPLEVRLQDCGDGVAPLVSIACLAYNHERFIREALEGFLSQKTTFRVEILIHDDASTDETAAIIREYEQSYPKLFKPIYQSKNQYSQGNHPGILNMHRARGTYIALCEGDDYWTDPLKLQKQVDYLERNPGYSVCVGGYTRLVEATGEKKQVISGGHEGKGFTFTLDEMQQSWLTKTLTAAVRRDVYEHIDVSAYEHYRDIHFFYHLLKGHKAYYMRENLGVYRVHEGGINSMKQGETNKQAAYRCYRELYEHNRDAFTRRMCLKHTLGLLNYNLFHRYKENNFSANFRLFREAVTLVRTLSEIKMLFTIFLKREWKDTIKQRYQRVNGKN